MRVSSPISLASRRIISWAAFSPAPKLARVTPGGSWLIRANSAVSQSNLEEAQGFLQWILDNTEQPYFRSVATLRLARLVADSGDHQKALTLLRGVETGELKALYDELTADLLAIDGNKDEALTLYRSALEAERLSGSSRVRIEMKIADLGLGLVELDGQQ